MQPFLEISFLWKTHETRPDTGLLHMGGALHMDRPYLARVRACRAPAAATLSVALLLQSSVAGTANPAAAGARPGLHVMRTAQLPRYSASGRHQCGSDKRSCVVSGLFSDCNDATSTLKARDCCPTTAGGGTSTGFSLSYCIPDVSGR
jgi:hypothetical protein